MWVQKPLKVSFYERKCSLSTTRSLSCLRPNKGAATLKDTAAHPSPSHKSPLLPGLRSFFGLQRTWSPFRVLPEQPPQSWADGSRKNKHLPSHPVQAPDTASIVPPCPVSFICTRPILQCACTPAHTAHSSWAGTQQLAPCEKHNTKNVFFMNEYIVTKRSDFFCHGLKNTPKSSWAFFIVFCSIPRFISWPREQASQPFPKLDTWLEFCASASGYFCALVFHLGNSEHG